MKIGEKGRFLKEYPFLKLKEESSPLRNEKPHIFIIPIESFNANFVENKNENAWSIRLILIRSLKRDLCRAFLWWVYSNGQGSFFHSLLNDS